MCCPCVHLLLLQSPCPQASTVSPARSSQEERASQRTCRHWLRSWICGGSAAGWRYHLPITWEVELGGQAAVPFFCPWAGSSSLSCSKARSSPGRATPDPGVPIYPVLRHAAPATCQQCAGSRAWGARGPSWGSLWAWPYAWHCPDVSWVRPVEPCGVTSSQAYPHLGQGPPATAEASPPLS